MLSEAHRGWLDRMHENGCTDSDLYDFCKRNKINIKEASRYMAELSAPSQCKGCKYIESLGIYGAMYPCSVCSRICKDMYKEEQND